MTESPLFNMVLQFEVLWSWLPHRYVIKDPVLLFTTDKSGFNLRTLLGCVQNMYPSVLIIKTDKGEVIIIHLSIHPSIYHLSSLFIPRVFSNHLFYSYFTHISLSTTTYLYLDLWSLCIIWMEESNRVLWGKRLLPLAIYSQTGEVWMAWEPQDRLLYAHQRQIYYNWGRVKY